MKNIAIFASGSGSNAENIYNYFEGKKDVNVKMIFTNRKDAYVIERAFKMNVPVVYFNKDMFYNSDVVVDTLKINKIDLVVLAGFLMLVPVNLVESYKDRIVNIHPALLPKFGGKGMYGDYVHKAVKESEENETGITIHYIDEIYDNGSIIFQKSVDIDEYDSVEQIADKVHKLEYEYYPKIIEKIAREL